MLSLIRRSLERYCDYHQREPQMLWYAGLLGTVCFPIFYLLRFAKATPVYDDLPLRLTAAGLCALLLLRKFWPQRLRPYFLPYSYVVLIFTLPFMFVFTSLKNGGGTVAVGNTLMAAFFVILMTDWRNMVAMLSLGMGAAALAFYATDPDPAFPSDYVARFPILMLVVVGGSFFKLALERATARKVRDAYAAIAGSIAHEMRHPLAQVRHSMEAMQRLLPPPGARTGAAPAPQEVDALYRHLAQGQQAIGRGLQVISMTLDQVGDKPLDAAGFAHLSAADVVRKAVDEYGYEDPSLRERVDVQVLEDFQFRGEETAYLFVLFNLIKNALYYLPMCPGLRVTAIVGGHAVKLRDNGPGIAPERLPDLFEPFRSLGKSGGTGLGLRYCRRVMHAFGGEIECASQQGEFTEFTMRFPVIPLAEQEAHAAAAIEAARVALSGRRLLLVEDDAAQRLTVRHKLRPLEVRIDEAPDGQAALELLASQPYDLLLMDLRMPVLDGFALARRIRQGEVPLNATVRIVAHSSEPEQAARLKAQRAGIDVFVPKPSPQVALARALVSAFQKPAAPRRPLEGRRILLADDSAINRRAVAAYLADAGAQVIEADHGAAVLGLLGTGGAFDAAVLDLNMPGLGGLETVRRIRASPTPWASLPVLALSAHSDEVTMADARDAGMNGFLVKPVTAEILTGTLATALRGTRPTPSPAEPALDAAGPLLNEHRLESYRRLGLLDELITDYLPEIQRLIGTVSSAVAANEFERVQEALHSLLGMSGEAGAQALHQCVRRVYVTVQDERRMPPAQEWLPQMRALADRSEQALRAFTTMPRADSDAA